jgi:serine/threonine protein kinase
MKALKQLGYTNLVHLATSGEGEVYICEKQGTKYIIKVVSPLENEQLKILNRVNALRNEYFPRIVNIINNEEKTIIIREYIAGTTLAEELKKNKYFSCSRAKEIIFDICSALRVLHSMKPHPIIFRDLKPDNIIITPDGHLKLIDFGIARYYKEEATRDTMLAGTKGYTAPEVMAGMQSDERSDVYSIGLVFYELLSGKSLQYPPYQIRPVAENNEFLPDYLDEIIAKATNINQTERYASIDEFIYELENIKDIKVRQKKEKRKRRLFIVLAVVAALTVIAALIIPALTVENVETLLELEFDDEADLNYFIGGDLEIEDGCLHVLGGWCDLDYRAASGTLTHFRVKLPQKEGGKDHMVGIRQERASGEFTEYRIYGTCEFLFFHNTDSTNYVTTWYQKLSGTPIANMGQILDIIFYTNEDNSAVYAFIYDSENESLAYIAYQIPEFLDDENYTIGVMSEKEGGDEHIIVDYFNLSEGSLKQYLIENIAAYEKYERNIGELLEKDASELPEMILKPGGEW